MWAPGGAEANLVVVLCGAFSYDEYRRALVPLGACAEDGRGKPRMTWRHVVAASALLVGSFAASATEVSVGDFFGQWRGVEVSVDDAERAPKLTPTDLDMMITGENGGFRIRTFALGRGPDGSVVARQMDATFAPTETPGVFAFDPGTGSLLSSLFADPAVGNPLEGDTLLWARLGDDSLHVYSLAIDPGGGYVLERSTGQLTEDGMVTRYELRFENDRVVTVEGRLERAGG